MGSTLAQLFASGQDPQQMLQQQGSMPMGQPSPFSNGGFSPGMRAMPDGQSGQTGPSMMMGGQPQMGGGGGMQQQGGGGMPQQRPMMGGGKGDMNPLMMLFPGIGRHMRERQMQDWQMGMAERQQRQSEAVNAYNMRKNEALASEESGERAAIGKFTEYAADHPEVLKGGLQGMLRGIKEGLPGIDHKMIGPVLQAWAPLAKEEDKQTIENARLAEKTQHDTDMAEARKTGLDIQEQKVGIQRENLSLKTTIEEHREKDRTAKLIIAQQHVDQTNTKLGLEAQKVAIARLKGDQAAEAKAREDAEKALVAEEKEIPNFVASQNIEDEETKKVFQDRLMQNLELHRHAYEHFAAPQSPLAGTPAQGQRGVTSAPSPTTSPFSGPKVGDVAEGHRFKGGEPGDPNNWELVQ